MENDTQNNDIKENIWTDTINGTKELGELDIIAQSCIDESLNKMLAAGQYERQDLVNLLTAHTIKKQTELSPTGNASMVRALFPSHPALFAFHEELKAKTTQVIIQKSIRACIATTLIGSALGSIITLIYM